MAPAQLSRPDVGSAPAVSALGRTLIYMCADNVGACYSVPNICSLKPIQPVVWSYAHCGACSARVRPVRSCSSASGTPFTTAGFARMMERAGIAAGVALKVHPHMLRQALANEGHDTRSLQAYLGHSNIRRTVRYTELAPDRFKHFWKD